MSGLDWMMNGIRLNILRVHFSHIEHPIASQLWLVQMLRKKKFVMNSLHEQSERGHFGICNLYEKKDLLMSHERLFWYQTTHTHTYNRNCHDELKKLLFLCQNVTWIIISWMQRIFFRFHQSCRWITNLQTRQICKEKIQLKKSVSSNFFNNLLLHSMIGGFYLSQITAHQH